MRILLATILVLETLASTGQSKRSLSAIASYQFFDRQAISLGVESSYNQRWENLKLKHQVQVSLQGQMFLDEPNVYEEKYYGLITDFFFCTRFFGLGGQFRVIFQDIRQRYEFSPSFKAGHKNFWIVYTWSGWNFGNNPFKYHRAEPPIEFSNGKQNIRLLLSIPMVKSKK